MHKIIKIIIFSTSIFTSFGNAQNRRNDEEFVHICGQFPNRYYSYEECPAEDGSGGAQPTNRANQPRRQQPARQQVCTRPGWRTVGIQCRNVNDCYQQRENVAMMCEQGQCCAPAGTSASANEFVNPGPGQGPGPGRPGTGRQGQQQQDAYTWWQTCENGGYFTGRQCRTTQDCRQQAAEVGRGVGQQRSDPLSRYEQICLQGECCTTNRELDAENNNNNNIPPNPNPNPPYLPNPNPNPRYPPNPSRPNTNGCLSFAGGRLVGRTSCQRHGDCNRLVGTLRDLSSIGYTEQLACVQRQCCVMARQLPPGIVNWQQLCPLRQGTFAGMFCHQSDADCAIGSGGGGIGGAGREHQQSFVCELNRYCCTGMIDRRRRQNQGCDDGDMVTGSRCQDDRDCYQREYCGDLVKNRGKNTHCDICGTMLLGPTDTQPAGPQPGGPSRPQPADQSIFPLSGYRTAAYCYNGEQSYVQCEFQSDCLETQSCMNGLCCVRSGTEWKSACGGAMAVSSCFRDRTCHDSLLCTSSDYCCECPYGQAAGKCTHGCPPNFACASNGYCCPRCMDGERPLGSCFNAQCTAGYSCVAGNICCLERGGLAIGRK